MEKTNNLIEKTLKIEMMNIRELANTDSLLIKKSLIKRILNLRMTYINIASMGLLTTGVEYKAELDKLKSLQLKVTDGDKDLIKYMAELIILYVEVIEYK